jgi:hypothetical protein
VIGGRQDVEKYRYVNLHANQRYLKFPQFRESRIQESEVRMKRQFLLSLFAAQGTRLTNLLFWILAPDF